MIRGKVIRMKLSAHLETGLNGSHRKVFKGRGVLFGFLGGNTLFLPVRITTVTIFGIQLPDLFAPLKLVVGLEHLRFYKLN